jgi:hypothetical protein
MKQENKKYLKIKTKQIVMKESYIAILVTDKIIETKLF